MNYNDLLIELRDNIQRKYLIEEQIKKEQESIIRKAYRNDLEKIDKRNKKIEELLKNRETNPNKKG